MKFRPPWYVLPKLTTPVASTKPMTCPKIAKMEVPEHTPTIQSLQSLYSIEPLRWIWVDISKGLNLL